MNIAYHSTELFARVTATSIVSIFENNKEIDTINVYLIENGFTNKTKLDFVNLANKYGRNIFFIPLPDFNGGDYNLGLVINNKNWLFDSYSRLFLDKLLPEGIERVIFLDGDTLVVDSLKELWEYDLKGKCCAACMDCISEPYYKLFELDRNSIYCNSGLILIDLNKWKDKHISDKFRMYIFKNHGYIHFVEQTVLNTVMQGEIVCLPAKYNVNSIALNLDYSTLMKLRKPLHYYSETEIKDAINSPVIIHMTTFFYIKNRAWNKVTNHCEQRRYAKYSQLLDWDGDILQCDKRGLVSRIKDGIMHAIPLPIVIYFASILYNSLRIANINITSGKLRKLSVN
jgi:lipopolysaccharide biosynthesis glycosyltransferase